jgi:hypothetical protein
MRGLRAAVFAIALALAGTALASGSFSLRFDPASLELDAILETEIRQQAGWVIYAGAGVSVSRSGVDRFAPYTIACRGFDAALAYLEVCAELRAPLVGSDSILEVYTTIVW